MTTKIYDEKYQKTLKGVLSLPLNESGIDKNNLYYKNYKFFQEKICTMYDDGITDWKDFLIHTKNHTIVLPIECPDLDMALTIFSTLNDRGMPLSDANIFKSFLYKNKESRSDKNNFIEKWNDLHALCDENIDIQDTFRYYMHIIRAKHNTKTNLIAIRTFFMQEDNKNLKISNLMEDLHTIASLWNYVANDFSSDVFFEKQFSFSDIAKKNIQILCAYPNEWGKILLTVLCYNRRANEIDGDLQKIVAILYYSFLRYKNAINIKPIAYQIAINIYKATTANILEGIDVGDVDKIFEKETISSRLTKGSLLLYAYTHKKQDFVEKTAGFHIEHIFPKKWQNTNYNGWEESDAQIYLDNIGNKILFEKRLNIQAGNGYFGKKKNFYKDSKIRELRALGNGNQQDWGKEEIINREDQIHKKLIEFFTAHLT